MKKFYLTLILLSSLCANAQYHKAKLLMASGNVKEGLAKLPSNKLFDTKIEFKLSKKGRMEKIDDDAIDKILYTSKKGTQFLFERNNVVHLHKQFGKEIKTEKKNKHWMLLFHSNNVIKGYSLSQRYKINKKGVMYSITGAHSIWEFVYFLLKRDKEDKGYIVSGKGFSNAQVRKAMAIYFKDTPAFVKRIKNKEFKKSTVTEVADEYAKYFN